MNKKIGLSILIMILSVVAASAQTTDTALKPVKTGNEWQMPGDAIKRSQDFANNLKKSLGLDEVTTKKVFQSYLANTKPVDEIGVATVSDKEKTDKMKANQVAFNQTLKGIMSNDQFDKYLKMQSKKSK